MGKSIMVGTQIALNADTLPDGDEKRILTLEEIADLQAGNGGGGNPFIGSLDDVPDSSSRLAMTVPEREKLADVVPSRGALGDSHANTTGNPHGVTAAEVGAITATDLAAHTSLTNNPHSVTAAQVGAPTTTQFNSLASDVAAITLGAGLRWVYGPIFVRNAQPQAALPAGETVWTNTCQRLYNLEKASKLRLFTIVSAVGSAGTVLRAQYTKDLTGATGWTSFSGMDISLATLSSSGVYSAEISVPADAKTQPAVLVRLVGAGGDGVATPSISFPSMDVLDSAVVTGSGGAGLPVSLADTTDSTAATGRLALTNAERAKLTNVPSDTTAALSGKAAVSHAHPTSEVTGLDTALTAKAPLVSPALTGTPTAPTPALDDSSTKLATTAFVKGQSVSAHIHAIADTTGLQTALDAKAPLSGAVLVNPSRSASPATGSNDLTIPTTAWVKSLAVGAHTHPIADITTLTATLTSLQDQINALTSGGVTRATQTPGATPVNAAEATVIFVRNTANATINMNQPTSLVNTTFVLYGDTKTVKFQGAGTNTIQGGDFTAASGTTTSPVFVSFVRDSANINQWNRV